MAIYKVSSDILEECKLCLTETMGGVKPFESITAWSKRRIKFRKRSEKLIKLLENEYYI